MDVYSEELAVIDAAEEEVKEYEEEQITDPIEEVNSLSAIVIDCYRLNIREKPTMYSKVLATIIVGTEVEVVEKKKADKFYKVKLSNGVEGFCMKDFIRIKS